MPQVPLDQVVDAIVRTTERRVEVTGRGSVERRDGYLVHESPIPMPEANGMIAIGPSQEAAIAALPAMLRDFTDRGTPFGLNTFDGRTPDVERAAEDLGLETVSAGTTMGMPADGFRPVPGGDLRFVRVRADASADLWVDVMAAGFEAPPEMFRSILTPGLVAHLDDPWLGAVIAYAGDEPVSTASFVTVGDATAIANVATPPAHRGRGFATAVTSEAVRLGLEAGARFAWLEASDLGLGVYERLGFERIAGERCRAMPSADEE